MESFALKVIWFLRLVRSSPVICDSCERNHSPTIFGHGGLALGYLKLDILHAQYRQSMQAGTDLGELQDGGGPVDSLELASGSGTRAPRQGVGPA